MNTDRIDIHDYQGKLHRELRRLESDERLKPQHGRDIHRFVVSARSGREGDRRRRKRVSDGRCLKLIWHLRRFAMEMPVAFDEVTLVHMERFVLGLESGSVGKLGPRGTGEPYSGDTITDFFKVVRQFYRWN